MNERRGIQQLVFSAALAASPFLSLAATQGQGVQHGSLRPATLEARLRPVHASDATVTPVVYRPAEAGENSSVQAELQNIFRENNQQRQVVHPQIAVRQSQTQIELVQHTADEDDSRRTRRRDSSERKPGLFKRLFSKISGNAEPERPIGEPAPPIPQPPPIIFETKPSSKLAAKNANKVTARPVGFRNGLGQSAAGQTTTATQDSRISGLQGPAKHSPQQTQAARKDNFINPFADEGRVSEDEALLDLDSLIQSPDSVERPQRKIELAPPAVEHQMPKQLADTEPKSDPASPFTGYRLDTDEQVFTAEDVAAIETGSTDVDTVTAPKTAGATTVIIANADAEATAEIAPKPQNGAIPLLAEPKTSTDESPVLEDFTEVPLVEESTIAAETDAPTLQEEIALPDDTTTSLQTAANTGTEKSERSPLPKKSPSVMPNEAEKLQTLSDRARQEQQIYRIMARSGETRFKGFCPVALRDQRQLIDARPEYKAKFGLQAYHFSSPDAKAAFEKNPSRYSPAAGGSDVVLLVNTGEEESGSLDFSLWYHDRLYMFRSRETQSIFSKDPLRYANQY